MDIHWERHTMDSLDTLLTKLPRLPLSAVAVTFTHSHSCYSSLWAGSIAASRIWLKALIAKMSYDSLSEIQTTITPCPLNVEHQLK